MHMKKALKYITILIVWDYNTMRMYSIMRMQVLPGKTFFKYF